MNSDHNEAQTLLWKQLSVGQTLTTFQETPSDSGMTHYLRVLRVTPDRRIEEITALVARAAGFPLVVNGGLHDGTLRVRGTGYHHGVHVVGCLAYALYGDELALRHESL